MLKSRRGLLAAGLAVAVVGALGVASTLNAGAEQISGEGEVVQQQEPAAAAPTSSDDAVTPPSVLPWGARPQRVSKGRAGVSARTLRSQGLDAAANDTSGSTQPRGRYAPKGRWAKSTSYLKTEQTDIAPPEPPGSPNAPAPEPSGATSDSDNVYYMYNVGSQAAETDGFYTNVYIAKPELDKNDYHSLGELALQSADGKQIVEVGWTVDRLVNGDDDPHLFVYHWVNKEESCYNGCGFVQYSKTIKPGDTLAQDTTKKFGIQYFNGAWWIAFDSEWVGYFPETLWNEQGVSFSKSGLVQVFGEVAASTETPCTDMGNGQAADVEKSTSAYMASISYLNGPAVSMFMRSTTKAYPLSILSARTFRYGGPGIGDC